MRVLLDESVPRDLAQYLSGHDIDTVTGIGWAGLANGELLERATSVYQAFVTMDASLPHQQVLSRFAIGVVLIRARSNRIEDLEPLVPDVLTTLESISPGDLRRVGA